MAVFIQFDTNRCSSNQFNMNSDRISIKKIEKLFDLYHNYSFPDQSNSAKIYVVRYSSKNLKFDVYRKYSNSIGNIRTQSEIFELSGYNYRSLSVGCCSLTKIFKLGGYNY